jgi:RNA-directed DNA polymerase
MEIIKSIAKKFLVKEDVIRAFVTSAPYRYKTYTIPKRNSDEKRIIEQPSKELKVVQRYVVDAFLNSLPIHNAATAYRKSRDIKLNAKLHKDNPYLLKMDFKKFFPSIVDTDLIRHVGIHIKTLNQDDKLAIKRIFFRSSKKTRKHWLSIGAPSSPFISNTILFEFDTLVQEFSDKNDITYTRYADDLTFTTKNKNILFETPAQIKNMCDNLIYPKLGINTDKTVLSSKKFNRHVTGIVLNNDGEISLGRKKKRYIKSLVFKYMNSQLSDEEVAHLRGLISFSSHIEPEYVERLKLKYGVNIINSIKFV